MPIRFYVLMLMASAATCSTIVSASAQNYRIFVYSIENWCDIAINRTNYELSVKDSSVTGRAAADFGFSAKLEPDGSFKAQFVADTKLGITRFKVEGNITPGHRTLRITGAQTGCVYEGMQ